MVNKILLRPSFRLSQIFCLGDFTWSNWHYCYTFTFLREKNCLSQDILNFLIPPVCLAVSSPRDPQPVPPCTCGADFPSQSSVVANLSAFLRPLLKTKISQKTAHNKQTSVPKRVLLLTLSSCSLTAIGVQQQFYGDPSFMQHFSTFCWLERALKWVWAIADLPLRSPDLLRHSSLECTPRPSLNFLTSWSTMVSGPPGSGALITTAAWVLKKDKYLWDPCQSNTFLLELIKHA